MVVLSNRPAVAYSDTFFRACNRLTPGILRDVMSFTEKFLQDPTSRGLNYERIQAIDPSLRSVRVNGSYRAIVRIPDATAPNTYFLLWVDAHDDAYDWAKRKVITHDSYTNAITLVESREEEVERKETLHEAELKGIFQKLDNQSLLNLGVEESALFMIRAVESKEQMEGIRGYMQAPVFENLSYIIADIPYEEVLELYKETILEVRSDQNMETALSENINKERFFLSETDEDQKLIEQYLNGEIDGWRIFLHPKQRKYVEGDYEGPVRIVGGPGTGKSVVAMHRTKYLLETIHKESDERILFTTFSSNLSEDLDEMMKEMLKPRDYSRLKVLNVDKVISSLLSEYLPSYRLIYGDDVLGLWSEAIRLVTRDEFTPALLKNEYEDMIIQNDINDLPSYFTLLRVGSGVRLNRSQKKLIWSIVEKYQELCDVRGILDAPSAEKKLTWMLKKSKPEGLYSGIVSDEVQDLRNSSLKFLRALGGTQKKNDLFLVGDNLQRIYMNSFDIRKSGVDVEDRTFALIHNYRTTQEISDFASKIIEVIPAVVKEENERRIQQISTIQGKSPVTKVLPSKVAEMEFVHETIKKWIAVGIDDKGICILTRTKNELNSVKEYFHRKGYRTFEIKPSRKDDKTLTGIRLSTMHRAKGLEFDCVVLIGMDESNMPNRKAVESAENRMEEKDLILQERLLLYVAVTRAKKEIAITCTGNMTPFLQL